MKNTYNAGSEVSRHTIINQRQAVTFQERIYVVDMNAGNCSESANDLTAISGSPKSISHEAASLRSCVSMTAVLLLLVVLTLARKSSEVAIASSTNIILKM